MPPGLINFLGSAVAMESLCENLDLKDQSSAATEVSPCPASSHKGTFQKKENL